MRGEPRCVFRCLHFVESVSISVSCGCLFVAPPFVCQDGPLRELVSVVCVGKLTQVTIWLYFSLLWVLTK